MKTGWKRIEATLHDLGNKGSADTPETGDSQKRPFSFRISVGTTESTDSVLNPSPEELENEGKTIDLSPDAEGSFSDSEELFAHHHGVQAFSTQDSGGKTPSLPKFKTPSFSNHRHGANPGLAMNLLKDIEETVVGWEKELHTILKQIQDVYLEGPIVNGWLESNTKEPDQGGKATLRHAEVEQLMDYVEEICAAGAKVSYQSSRTGYRLCGVDASGQVWTRPCPPDQVPSVSMAIARYQKLRQLLGRKQYLETRLSQLAETLVILHSHVQQA